jgi:hypothetical protein
MQEADDENKRKTTSIAITNLLNNSILKAVHNGMNDLHIKLHQISTLRSNVANDLSLGYSFIFFGRWKIKN